MSNETRRTFLKQSGLGVAGVAAAGCSGALPAAGANDRIVVGLIGCGGRGPGVADGMGGAQYVCDPDPRKEQIVGDEQANRMLARRYHQQGHWAIPKGV